MMRAPPTGLALVVASVLATSFHAAAAAQEAAANVVCDQRNTFVQALEQKFSEQPVALGLTSDGKVLEVLASASGSWTMIVTAPNGLSCVLTAGEAWSKHKPPIQTSRYLPL